jgi:hypothetical protein
MGSSSILKPILRTFIALIALAFAITGAGAALLVHPQPLFAYHVSDGRLELWSDKPFSEEAGRRILADVEGRIDTSQLNRPHDHFCIFVVNTAWRRRLTFLWSTGAAGLAYYPLTHNVFIRTSDIELGVVFGASGVPAPPPRTLAYFAAHEIGHNLTGEAIGPRAYFRLPVWVREGVADYIGFAGAVDVADLARQLRAGADELDPRLGFYARYRLLVAYLIKNKGWSIVRILAEAPKQALLEEEIRNIR